MQPIPVLFENTDLIIVNKPIGIAMHDATSEADVRENIAENGEPEKIDGIVTRLKKQLAVTELHLCHRLDTGTSGCLCLAKNAAVAGEIGELFSSRRVSKYYLALSDHKPKKKQGMIMGDMKNRRGGQRVLLKTTENPAITQFFSSAAKPGTRGFIVKPHSGKPIKFVWRLKALAHLFWVIHFMGVRHQTGCIFMHGICTYLCLLVNYRLRHLSIQVKS